MGYVKCFSSFFFSVVVEAVGCFHFGQQRRQVNLDSMKHEGKTKGVTHQQRKRVFEGFLLTTEKEFNELMSLSYEEESFD